MRSATPYTPALCRAIANRAADTSTATTKAPARANAIALPPQPANASTTSGGTMGAAAAAPSLAAGGMTAAAWRIAMTSGVTEYHPLVDLVVYLGCDAGHGLFFVLERARSTFFTHQCSP
jgi:hypothetical protein